MTTAWDFGTGPAFAEPPGRRLDRQQRDSQRPARLRILRERSRVHRRCALRPQFRYRCDRVASPGCGSHRRASSRRLDVSLCPTRVRRLGGRARLGPQTDRSGGAEAPADRAAGHYQHGALGDAQALRLPGPRGTPPPSQEEGTCARVARTSGPAGCTSPAPGRRGSAPAPAPGAVCVPTRDAHAVTLARTAPAAPWRDQPPLPSTPPNESLPAVKPPSLNLTPVSGTREGSAFKEPFILACSASRWSRPSRRACAATVATGWVKPHGECDRLCRRQLTTTGDLEAHG